MTLKELLQGQNIEIPSSYLNLDVRGVSCDSRTVEKDHIFVALPGTHLHGADFIDEAVKKGARVIVTNSKAYPQRDDCLVLHSDNPKDLLLKLCQKIYDLRGRSVKTIGVTGTNGKTTITYLLEAILQHAGKQTAVIGTVNHRIGRTIIPSRNTTPGLVDIHRIFSQMAREHIEFCLMEVSSHALDQGRTDGIEFSTSIFTNLTGDHLDYHGTMEKYFEAKTKLFTRLAKEKFAVINNDDPYAERLKALCSSRILTYGIEKKSDVTALQIRLSSHGSRFEIHSPAGARAIKTPLIGRHNIYNILAAAAALLAEGFTLDDIQAGTESLSSVPGRLERVQAGQDFSIFVDYAHTEDALKNVLTNLKIVCPSKIILVCCEPDSLASDLAKFLKNGWKIESAAVFDFFPQTPNVESAAVLRLDSKMN